MSNEETQLLIGASGAIGTALAEHVLNGDGRIIAARRSSDMPAHLDTFGDRLVHAKGCDLRNEAAVHDLIRQYAGQIGWVWNLAAPLSLEAERDPALSEDVTVGGMRRVLEAMQANRLHKIFFSDSIGSFGATSPRDNAAASWLVDNPQQDPGSAYGEQKRECQNLMAAAVSAHGFDARSVVIPGVLHTDEKWGDGTTEYALEAMKAAAEGREFVLPIDPETVLPMIHRSDLVRAMWALANADADNLNEPRQMYTVAGFSFSALELFEEIKRHKPGFRWRQETNDAQNRFANQWPNSISGEEARRDFGYTAEFGLEASVAAIMEAHEARGLYS